MKKSMRILPLVFAVLILLTGCGPKTDDNKTEPPAAEVNGQADEGTVTDDTDQEENETDKEETNDADEADETTDGEQDEADNTGDAEDDDIILNPNLDLKLPDMKVVDPTDDDDDNIVNPNLDLKPELKVTLPKINPPIPEPEPGL